jgi:Trk K+ transport system NAD-binding subunit
MNYFQVPQKALSSFSFQKKQLNFGEHVIGVIGSAMARILSSEKERTILVGANSITRLIAAELDAIGSRNVVISLEEEIADSRLDSMARSSLNFERIVLEDAGISNAKALISVLPDSKRNIAICRSATELFQVPAAIARTHSGDGAGWTKVNGYGMIQIGWQDLIRALVSDAEMTPALARIAQADETEDIGEIEILLPTFVGRSVNELPIKSCDVLALRRGTAPVTNFEETPLEMGDMLTVIGSIVAIENLSESFSSL